MIPRVDVMDLAEDPPRPAEDDGLGCLRTERGNLPLDTIDVETAITGLASSIELSQGFHNPHETPLEATYIFPLPPRAAVTALRMEADGRTVDGVLKERAQARADYAQAVTEGKRASIAEEERPGVFTMRVGNIMPGERVSVHVTLAGTLSFEDGSATFRFPLVVAPRYIPGEPLPGGQVGDGVTSDTDAVPDASRISPPVLLPGFPNPVRLSVAVDVDPAGLPLDGVSTSLHATATTEDSPSGLRVRLDPGERVDRDFLLRLNFADDAAVRTALAVRPDDENDETAGGTFALTLLPPARPTPPRPRDVVLVLDRSGSMGGWKMVAARRAAARIVDTLAEADRFAVLAFDNVVTTPPGFPDGLVEATDRNRFHAVEFLSGVPARGGTEMLSPLTTAAKLLASGAERDRVLVLVTDGQVGNEDQLLRTLAPAMRDVRVHTVGIDRAVNEGFLQRLAGSSGRYELVESEDRLDEAMQQIHRRIASPVVTGLRLTSNGLSVDQDSLAPIPLPDLFEGAPAVVTGRYTGSPSGGITVTGDGGWSTSAAASRCDNPALAALWARARVRDLEDRYVIGRGEQDELEKQIVGTSLKFGVLSRFTAFVAVDERVVNESGTVHRVTQPVDLPSGWDPEAIGGYGHQPLAMTSGAAGVAAASVGPQSLSFAAPMSPMATGRRHGPGSPAPAADSIGTARPEPTAGQPARPARKRQAPSAPIPAPEATQPPLGTSEFPVAPGQPLPTLAAFAIKERDVLVAAANQDVWARAALLRALAERIKPLLAHWRETGERETAVHSMTVLAKDISDPTDNPNMADSLWHMAVVTLDTVSKPKPPPRSTFWKH